MNLKRRGIDGADIELLFQDEMRYGLISNYRRSWSKVGKRTELKNQQAYVNRYLYSSVAPVSGESFHIMGFPDMNGLTMKIYLEKLQEAYPKKHIVLVWDNAPCHRLSAFQEMESVTIVPLPSYSPQLNPTERFFGEMRKSTANRFFKTIASQEDAITEMVLEYADDHKRMKTLTGYDWIREQWERVF
jgi:transposase